MQIKEIRNALGVTQKEFSRIYKIPVRTIQDWERGERTPPEYVVELLERAVMQDYPDRLKVYAKKMTELQKSKK